MVGRSMFLQTFLIVNCLYTLAAPTCWQPARLNNKTGKLLIIGHASFKLIALQTLVLKLSTTANCNTVWTFLCNFYCYTCQQKLLRYSNLLKTMGHILRISNIQTQIFHNVCDDLHYFKNEYCQSSWTCTILAWKCTPLSQSHHSVSFKKSCDWLRAVHFHAQIVHVQGLWR